MLAFRDAASRRELLAVIALLADNQPGPLVANLLPCLLNSGVISKTGDPRYCRRLTSRVVVVELTFHTEQCVTLTCCVVSRSVAVRALALLPLLACHGPASWPPVCFLCQRREKEPSGRKWSVKRCVMVKESRVATANP